MHWRTSLYKTITTCGNGLFYPTENGLIRPAHNWPFSPDANSGLFLFSIGLKIHKLTNAKIAHITGKLVFWIIIDIFMLTYKIKDDIPIQVDNFFAWNPPAYLRRITKGITITIPCIVPLIKILIALAKKNGIDWITKL